MQSIGLDIGYRAVKAKSARGEVHLDSAVGPGSRDGFKTGLGENGIVLDYGGRTYFVGELALRQSRYSATLSRDRTRTPEYLVLFQAAISKALGDREAQTSHARNQGVFLVPSLPILHFEADEEYVEQAFLGKHEVSLNGHPRKYRVSEVLVVPQSFGILMQYGFNEDLSERESLEGKRIAVVDFGGLNINFALFEDSEYIGLRSTSVDGGMSSVHQDLIGKVLETYDYEITEQQADAALRRGTLQVEGKPRDIKKLAAPLLENLAERADKKAHSQWGIKGLDRILVSGGGASTAGAIFARRFKVAQVFGSEMSNAIGQYIYGLLMKGG